MNNIFISHTSAFLIYRLLAQQYLQLELLRTKHCPSKNQHCTMNMLKSLEFILEKLEQESLDVLIVSSNTKHKSRNFRFHSYTGSYPSGSFFKIKDNVFIASPELLFCQMAQTLSVEKLLLLGFELCGTYSICPETESGFIGNVRPWTCADKINRYVDQLRNSEGRFYGIKKAKFAAKYTKSNSASPLESRLGIVLGGSRKIGAFNIKNLEMNAPVSLSKSASEICGQRQVIPDLSVPAKKIAIEYDSDAFHDNVNQNRRDKKRIDALQHDGWLVFNFVSDQFYNVNALKHMAKDILKANGQSIRIRANNFDTHLNNLLKNL